MRKFLWLGISALALAACSSDSSGGPSGSAGAGGQGTAGVSGADSGSDVALDQGVADTKNEAKADAPEAAAACVPADVSSWTPSWKPPTALHQGKCGAGEAKTLIDDCFGTAATEQKCAAAETKYADCNTCLFSDETDAQWGPIIAMADGAYYDVNTGGCFAQLLADTSASSCGAKLNAQYECGRVACAACPLVTDQDYTAFNDCVAAVYSDSKYCKTYTDAADGCSNAAIAADGGEALNDCIWGAEEDSTVAFERVGELFCGGATTDGGSPVDATKD